MIGVKGKSSKGAQSTATRYDSFDFIFLATFFIASQFLAAATVTESDSHLKGSALEKPLTRNEEKREIQKLLESVDHLYEKVLKQSQSSPGRTSNHAGEQQITKTLREKISSYSSSQVESPSQLPATDSLITILPTVESLSDYKGVNLAPLRLHLSAAHSKNIVFALAANIDPKYFAIFIKSFRKHSKDSTMFVFVNRPVDAKVHDLAEENDIILIDYDIDQLEPTFLQKYHPSSLRWILYDRILRLPLVSSSGGSRVFGSVVEKIIALDARDSAFQRDPFTLFSGVDDKLLVFGEDRHSAIGQCGWNSAWVKDCFPRSVYDQVARSPIICSGISMGAASAMVRYVRRMADIISGEEKQLMRASEHFPHCERNGVDQGVHNVLVHAFQGDLNIQILYPEDFPVVNMQSGKEMTIISQESEASGPVRRVFMRHPQQSNSNEAFAIVHQFDRDNDLQASLAKEYIDWINWGDTKSEWDANPACATMVYVDQADLFKAMCDIGAARAISAATCCEACSRKTAESGKQCTGFTYYGGVCYLKNCDMPTIRRQSAVWKQSGTPSMRLSGALSGFLNPTN